MLSTLAASLIVSSIAANDPAHLGAEKYSAIDRYVAAEMERQRIPGLALGIYKNGSIVLAKGYGLSNVELNVPMTADSALQSGSVGKSFTATAIMMLVEQGKISLDDSITTYFPEGPESWKAIKVANLLSHTSGLAAYDTPERQKTDGPFDIRRDFSQDELVAAIAKLPIDFKVGESWSYENTNYVLLGILIQRVSGQSYAEFLRQHVFSPLGMASTRIISDIDIVPNRSAGYEIVGGTLRNQAWVSPTFNATADGTIYFTINDIEHWDHALYGETLLKAESLEKMWTPYPYAGKTSSEGYGFGWEKHFVNGHRVIEHDGAWQGFTTSFSRYVDDKLTVVVLTNLDSGHSNPAAIVRAVAGMVDPALAVEPRVAMVDDRADLSAKAWEAFQKIIRGESEPDGVAIGLLSDLDLEDLRTSLPEDWAEKQPELVARKGEGDTLHSTYRIGKGNNKRLIDVRTNSHGEITSFEFSHDPDNR